LEYTQFLEIREEKVTERKHSLNRYYLLLLRVDITTKDEYGIGGRVLGFGAGAVAINCNF